MHLSVVVTILNERDNIRPLLERIHAALGGGMEYEVIYVDDGSTDGSVELLKSLDDPHLVIVELRKNYGQSLALMAGIDIAAGEYIATMDGDLQNDPADLPAMLELLEEGPWDLVVGERVNRQDGSINRKLPSRIANWLIRKLSGVHLRDYGCALKLFRAEIAKDIGVYGELHRFISVLASLEGARITQIPVRHHARQFGKSKYGIGRTFKVVSDLILMLFLKKYLQKPMHLFAQVGMALFAVGAIRNFYLLGLKVLGQDIWGKPLLILGALLVLTGVQLITVGIVVEVLMRTYYESQGKRPYKVREIRRSGIKEKLDIKMPVRQLPRTPR